MDKKKIGIIGATGYTGSELMRILPQHPHVEVTTITSESRAGEKFSEVHPFFEGIADQVLIKSDAINVKDLDLVFLALPHGISMDFVKQYHGEKFKIIDLSGDFRLESPDIYKKWYLKDHSFHEGFAEAVYGIPELFSKEIKSARLIANPGCFPTGALLGMAPLAAEGLRLEAPIIIDSKTGVTGAGVQSKPVNLFSNVHDNFKAYGLKSHRHTIEIQDTLKKISGANVTIQFTPHLLPVDRGILSTIYLQPSKKNWSDKSLVALFEDFYQEAPFVRIRKQPPAIKEVRGTNYCDIFPVFDDRTGMVIVITAIDNLVKGAAGQAVQNMNLIFDWDETQGLNQIPVHP